MGHIQSKSNLHTRVLGYIQKHDLMPRGHTVLVGVSGGSDSVCMLHLLAGMQETLGVRLHVAHLNHSLRGADADADAAYVSALARDLGLPATVDRRDVLGHRDRSGLSLEEAAREVRYGFFADVARAAGTSIVAVGHTLDDQAESILLHVVRGAGLRGLRGMLPLSPWGPEKDDRLLVARPLLEVSRQETADYCQQLALSPRIDVSNYSPAFLRNRLRQIMPSLKTLNPAVDMALLRLGQASGEAVEFLDKQVDAVWPGVVRRDLEESPGLVMDKGLLRAMPVTVQRQLLLRAWERVRANPQDIETVHIEEMLSALDSQVGTSLDLPGELVFIVGYDAVGLGPRSWELEACPYSPIDGDFPLSVPGDTRLPGWNVVATVISVEEAATKYPGADEGTVDSLSACMDLRMAGEELWVRSRRPGDTFRPLGLGGEKKLQDLMVDLKIPRSWRKRVPLVCSPRGVLWVVGHRLSDAVKITENTDQVLLLEFRPTTPR